MRSSPGIIMYGITVSEFSVKWMTMRGSPASRASAISVPVAPIPAGSKVMRSCGA
jgi:hypothetical protein